MWGEVEDQYVGLAFKVPLEPLQCIAAEQNRSQVTPEKPTKALEGASCVRATLLDV